MALYLKDVQLEQGFAEPPELTLRLGFDSSSPAMTIFIGELLHGSPIWNSDKLMALAQLMFEVEQAPKTITKEQAFQKHGKMLKAGDYLTVAEFPPLGHPVIAGDVSHFTTTQLFKVVD